jgi:flavin reductase (DIM6/NTAB) family NADH-FMN oxidoreductase RutF
MRRLPAGVAVLTLVADGRALGVTVGSLASVSLEPPLVSVAIGTQTPAHEPLRRAGAFAVSVLAGDQAPLARHFARGTPPLVLWDGVETRGGDAPGPLLAGAVAWLGCRVAAAHPAGDHTLFLAAVESLELGRDATGLVYRGGEYRAA